jgi:hypothetical protein
MVTHKAELAIRSAFKRAGFGVVDPKEDVRTMPLWLMKGYRPARGLDGGARSWCPPVAPEPGEAANRVRARYRQ